MNDLTFYFIVGAPLAGVTALPVCAALDGPFRVVRCRWLPRLIATTQRALTPAPRPAAPAALEAAPADQAEAARC